MRGVRGLSFALIAAVVAVAGCHHEATEELPLYERKISIADKFYDVAALSADRAVVVGYGGKILSTDDGGRTWTVEKSGVSQALYSVEFVDANLGWISGQDGVILHTEDGGKTWTKQVSGTTTYLFAIDFTSPLEGWAVGDLSTALHTRDGGKNWQLTKIGGTEHLSKEEALLAQEPILYDVQFLDADTGWVVGEFGNIFHTTDRGRTWKSQQDTLLGGGIFSELDIPTFFGVNFVDKMNGITAGLEGRVARTHDGGQTWKFEKIDVKIPLVDPLFAPFQFPDTTAWAVGAAGEVVRQTEPGAPWKGSSLGMEIFTWLRGIDFLDKDNGWIVGGYGLILHTTDGGTTWLPSIG
jgi:photosystem II stability/assembly factor-like uncharacterized protein